MTDTTASEPGWWIMPDEALMEMLRRAHAGEDPEALYVEEYANSEHGLPK